MRFLVFLICLLIFNFSFAQQREKELRSKVDSIADQLTRDPVGDINAEQVSKAEIPGATVVARNKIGVLAIGGFFKTLAIADTKSELRSDAFVPGFLGLPGVDPAEKGQFYMDARATRLSFSALADVDGVRLKGYLEWNFRGEPTNFSFRLAYLTLTTKSGQGELLAGKYFSNIGDGLTVPDALSEPTVSGLMVNVREEQVKWTQRFASCWKWSVSVENAPTNDLFGLKFKQRAAPAFTGNVSWTQPAMRTHVFVGGMVRKIWVTDSAGDHHSTGWILDAGTHYQFTSKLRAQYSAAIGDALGNYMVGTDPLSAGVVLPGSGLDLRRGMGHYLAFQYKWTDKVRSNIMSGITVLERVDGVPSFLTRSTTQLGLNTMWRVKRFLTVGIEYWHGTRKQLDDLKYANDRFVVGVQLF